LRQAGNIATALDNKIPVAVDAEAQGLLLFQNGPDGKVDLDCEFQFILGGTFVNIATLALIPDPVHLFITEAVIARAHILQCLHHDFRS